MKKIAILLLSFFLFKDSLFSQQVISTYYNYKWEGTSGSDDANYISNVLNTDSGWYRNDFYITNL